ncbi:MAG: hypothetical protein U1B83_03200 [Candidatus Cloacimonadaceae bacterium]|nr:hypothetical protein [Candidatus Cloacimonadaceae bacterium]
MDSTLVHSGKPAVKTEFGLLAALSTTGTDADWENSIGGKLGLYASRQFGKNVEMLVELHIQQLQIARTVPHPYPYVISMRERIDTTRLRVPLSCFLLGETREGLTPLLGLGIYLDTTLYSRQRQDRDLISETQIHRYNISEENPQYTIGMSIHWGLRINQLRVDLRFCHDLTRTDIPSVYGKAFRHTDIGFVLGYPLN